MTPDKYTISEHFLEVGHGHTIYMQEWGNPKATTPIFFLHGGPGSATSDSHKMQFDPEVQRVIFHDQRGAGRSLPYGELEHNTTKELIADIVTLADKLKIDSFILTGGSWGACLALAFALAHPKRVKGLVLNGIFTGSQKEIDWLEEGQFRTFFPEVWERYVEATPLAHRKKPGSFHFDQAFGADPLVAKQSAYTYEQMEGGVLRLDDRQRPGSFEDYDPTGVRIEMHYLKNRCFMPDRHILDNAHKLAMPVHLVQGRYDMVCPPVTAHELQRQAPDCKLYYTISGHMNERESWNISRAILGELSR